MRRSPGVGMLLRGARTHVPLLPALVLMLLPKCPLCLAAYCGILGSLGASSLVRSAWGLPMGVGLLGFTLGALALRARRVRDFRPVLVGLAGAVAVLGGKLVLDAPPLLYGGGAALAFASIWSVRIAPRPGIHGTSEVDSCEHPPWRAGSSQAEEGTTNAARIRASKEDRMLP